MTEDSWADGLCFAPMTLDAAKVIADTWKYPAPYDFYDATADAEDHEEFITPDEWPAQFWQVARGDQLVGYFSANPTGGDAQEISLALRPDLTGGGRGAVFLCAALKRLREKAPADRVVLSVAEFNERAIKVYESVGFRATRWFAQATNGGVHDFVEMELATR